MDYHRAFPFYHAYPQYGGWNQLSEDRVLEDLEYLQQMYPASAKQYQAQIDEMLNRMDYEGSMIYDQYPDRWQLERLIRSIMSAIRAKEGDMGEAADDGRWTWIQELVTVLVYYEILKRRRKKKNFYVF